MSEKIFDEAYQGDFYVRYPYHRILCEKQTRYQHVALVDTVAFGRTLFLDRVLNSAESDEFVYHEGIVHPALLRAAARSRVLIIGGAEGGTLREVLKYNDVESAVMVDIDEELVDICREHLADIYGDPWSDRRVELVFADGREYVSRCGGFDAIIIDLNEASEGGPAQKLFTVEFYEHIRRALNPGGMIAIQSEWIHTDFHLRLTATHRAAFAAVRVMECHIPSFLMSEAFNLCTMDPDRLELSPDTIDELIARKDLELRYYEGSTDWKCFCLAPYQRKLYDQEAAVFSDRDLPVYLFSPTIGEGDAGS